MTEIYIILWFIASQDLLSSSSLHSIGTQACSDFTYSRHLFVSVFFYRQFYPNYLSSFICADLFDFVLFASAVLSQSLHSFLQPSPVFEYLTSTYGILLMSLALSAQCSVPYSKAGTASDLLHCHYIQLILR
jgi:hypothetical protein